jgi:hypothetical protein
LNEYAYEKIQGAAVGIQKGKTTPVGALQALGKGKKNNLEPHKPLETIKNNFWRFTSPWKGQKNNSGALQALGKGKKNNLELYKRLYVNKK